MECTISKPIPNRRASAGLPAPPGPRGGGAGVRHRGTANSRNPRHLDTIAGGSSTVSDTFFDKSQCSMHLRGRSTASVILNNVSCAFRQKLSGTLLGPAFNEESYGSRYRTASRAGPCSSPGPGPRALACPTNCACRCRRCAEDSAERVGVSCRCAPSLRFERLGSSSTVSKVVGCYFLRFTRFLAFWMLSSGCRSLLSIDSSKIRQMPLLRCC